MGGGHAHVQVLDAFARTPPPDTAVTVVVDRPVAVYSGMVPGYVAGEYQRRDLEIDVRPLADRIGATTVEGRVICVDAEGQCLEVDGAEPVPFDVVSFNIGSTVAGGSLPGVREFGLPTRPIADFVDGIDAVIERARHHDAPRAFRVIVVGGGPGGVELALTLDARLRRETKGRNAITLVESGTRILPGYGADLARRAARIAGQRGVGIQCGLRVIGVEDDAVCLAHDRRLDFDALIWVAGAASHGLFRDSGLPTSDAGYVRTRSTLQIEGHDRMFAVGDCAHLIDHPETPKAGVYAVREGPIVARNLRAFLAGTPLATYTPQSDFLTLLNVGDGVAIGAKWGWTVQGRWVHRWKDWIDRKFMRRFQV